MKFRVICFPLSAPRCFPLLVIIFTSFLFSPFILAVHYWSCIPPNPPSPDRKSIIHEKWLKDPLPPTGVLHAIASLSLAYTNIPSRRVVIIAPTTHITTWNNQSHKSNCITQNSKSRSSSVFCPLYTTSLLVPTFLLISLAHFSHQKLTTIVSIPTLAPDSHRFPSKCPFYGSSQQLVLSVCDM